jgi:hypothetical protein
LPMIGSPGAKGGGFCAFAAIDGARASRTIIARRIMRPCLDGEGPVKWQAFAKPIGPRRRLFGGSMRAIA